MQEVLTTTFGLGVLTVATVALLNVACLRLHDVQKRDSNTTVKDKVGRLLYAYVYDSTSAFEAREKLRNLPAFLGWTGVGAITVMQLLYGVAYWTTCPNERVAILDVITWMSIVSYVVVLLCIAAVVSNMIYGVLAEVNRD